MTNGSDTDTTTPETRDLHAIQAFCECGHSAFAHDFTHERPCLYSVCECLRFTDSAA